MQTLQKLKKTVNEKFYNELELINVNEIVEYVKNILEEQNNNKEATI